MLSQGSMSAARSSDAAAPAVLVQVEATGYTCLQHSKPKMLKTLLSHSAASPAPRRNHPLTHAPHCPSRCAGGG
jgi:hypothetical protein